MDYDFLPEHLDSSGVLEVHSRSVRASREAARASHPSPEARQAAGQPLPGATDDETLQSDVPG